MYPNICASSKTTDYLVKSSLKQKKLELEPGTLIRHPQADMQIQGYTGKMANLPATNSCGYVQNERALSLLPVSPERQCHHPHLHLLASPGLKLPRPPLVHAHSSLLSAI